MNEQQKKVNIYELADATGFSISTVSKALNKTGRISEKTRNIILQKATEMNYIASYHAKTLSQKKSWIIAVIFADNLSSGFSHPYFSVILEHFKRRVEEDGYEVTFINRNMANSEMTYLEFCQYRKVEGVFMVNTYQESRQIPELINSGIPIVSSDAGDFEIPTVTSDDLQGGRLASTYLVDLGHKKICHIAGPQYTVSGRLRKQGFEDVMKESGISDYQIIEAHNYGFLDGYETAKEIIEGESLPTAIFAAGDWMALGVIRALQEKGIRVPEDVSVIGYDDLDFVKYNNPALTTISQKKEEIGRKCAEYLLQTIKGESFDLSALDVELIERDTCKKV